MPLPILATCLILISSVIICLLSVVWCQEASRDHQGGWVAILQVERSANHPLPWRRGVLWSLWSLTKPSWCLALDTLPLNSTPPPLSACGDEEESAEIHKVFLAPSLAGITTHRPNLVALWLFNIAKLVEIQSFTPSSASCCTRVTSYLIFVNFGKSPHH